jgi:chromate transporter
MSNHNVKNSPDTPQPTSVGISRREAFWFWFKLGFISFGGPAGQIAMMHTELVDKRRWISDKRFLHALNFCMVLPGPEAQQLATYLGWLMHRTWGGIVAGTLFILPSLLLIVSLSWVYMAYGDTKIVAGLFYGIKPAVTVLVIQASYRIGSRTLHNPWLWTIAVLSFLALFVFDLPFPLIIAVAALIGWLGGKRSPESFSVGHASTAHKQSTTTAIIDDHSPQPPHTLFSYRRLYMILSAAVVLWCVPMLAMIILWGWHHTITQMAWFFTKAALLTFGGAYAVLPYVYQAAVETFAWLTPTQMIDGLALGETTPGPLIMVVAFVGFVGAFAQSALGPDHAVLSGIVAACVVTWFTFLPSFIFILAGGPFIESTHGKLAFTAALTGVTAAVVGVIANLALFFAMHVGWPDGWVGGLDLKVAAIAAVAAVAIFIYKRGAIETIIGAALLGYFVAN